MYATTTRNRIVNASPPIRRLGLRSARSVASLAPTPQFASPGLASQALIRAGKPSFTTGTLCAIVPKIDYNKI